MRVPATVYHRQRLSLPARRTAVLARIHAARADTAQIGRRLIVDLHATEQSRRSILTGLKVFKASLVAAGVIWSFNASSRIGRGSRLFTIAISMLSWIRTMRKVSAFLIPLKQLPERTG